MGNSMPLNDFTNQPLADAINSALQYGYDVKVEERSVVSDDFPQGRTYGVNTMRGPIPPDMAPEAAATPLPGGYQALVVDQYEKPASDPESKPTITFVWSALPYPPAPVANKWKIPAIVAVVVAVLALVAGGIFLATKPQAKYVPNVVGVSLTDAQNQITEQGFTVGDVTYQPNNTVAKDFVVSQDPAAATEVTELPPINLVVSSGPSSVTVPNLIGTQVADANKALNDASLQVGKIKHIDSPQPEGTIIAQTPKSLTDVKPGTKIDLTVANGKRAVPDVVGMKVDAATKALEKAGFKVNVTNVESSTADVGFVVSQTPDPGNSLSEGDAVAISVVNKRLPDPTPTPTASPTTSPKPTDKPSSTPTKKPSSEPSR